MLRILPWVVVLSAIFYIFLLPNAPIAVELFFKVLPIILIILYAFYNLPERKVFVHYAIIIGLIFSAIGDITLQWFVIGLTSFLIAHIFYLIGFFIQWRSSFVRTLTLLPIVIYAYIIGNGVLKSITDQSLVVPVTLYMVMLSVMAWSAVMTRNMYAAIGAILFVISDSILAWNMFVTDVPYSSVLIMLFYYSAQFFIAYSIKYFNSEE
ncbi:lysoplasmalogenase [Filobacillus milosensis]|uniref:Lysoplasmalogenase n=1 Tax=Filobacillus milosensis TaxID=94137 RepID=A0A4Y8IKS4_9BACI|nr:lysoplasmalogenase [Filobacillus milosensis]TFB21730.1 lysoplasmalogenase [Filobacillus milosensis]